MFQYDNARLSVCKIAESWIRTPFKEGAALKGLGVDCGRILCCVYREAGFNTPDIKTLPHFPHGWFLHRNGEDYLDIVKNFTKETDESLPANIVMFRIGRQWAHAGIIIQWPKIVHAIDPMVQYGLDHQIPFVGKERMFLTPF